MPKNPPKEISQPEAQPEVSEPKSTVAIAGLGDDLTQKVEEVNQPLVAAKEAEQVRALDQMSRSEANEIYSSAQEDNRKMDFVSDILEARKQTAVKPYTPPPTPPAIAERTRLEMEAGRRRVEEFAAQAPRKQPKQEETGTVSVFRPSDYVPDQKKGQGLVPGNTARPA